MQQIPQIDYSVKQAPVVPSYRHSKLYQQAGGVAITVSTSSLESVWELPNRVMNLANSYLQFTMTPTGGTHFNYIFTDKVAPVRQIQLYTRGGVFLADVNYADRYTDIVLKSDVKLDDAPLRDTGAVGAFTTAFGAINGSVEENHRAGVDNVPITDNPNEPAYFAIGADTTATPVLNVKINLSDFKNTILAMDKDFYFNEVMMLKVIWNDCTAWGLNATAATYTNTGHLALGDVAVSKLHLYLALENNPVINASLINQVLTKGMSSSIPYVYTSKNAVAASTGQNVSLRFNRSHGSHLKKIYHVPYNDTETRSTRYLHSNLAGTIITDFFTSVDNVRRQEYNVTIADQNDWELIRPYIKNTPLNKMNTYRYNWFVLDKFDDDFVSDGSDSAVKSGLPLGAEHKWDIQMTTSNTALKHYTFAIVAKDLIISPNGIFVQ